MIEVAAGVMLSVSIHTYVCMLVCDPQKSLSGTLEVDQPFETLAVNFTSNYYRLALSMCSRNAFLMESRIRPFWRAHPLPLAYQTMSRSLRNWVRM